MRTLEYLERCTNRNTAWTAYKQQRSIEIARLITQLRLFANHNPASSVAANCHEKADSLQRRLEMAIS